MSVGPSRAERTAGLPGDDLVPAAKVVMDRAFTVSAPPGEVWPWFVQLGKRRGGWYLPRAVERLMPSGRRALRHIEPALQTLAVGDVIPDWGGKNETFEVAMLTSPTTLVHTSTRGRISLSWGIILSDAPQHSTRVHLRLRLGGVRRERLAAVAGGFFDWLTIAGLAAGLRERLREPH